MVVQPVIFHRYLFLCLTAWHFGNKHLLLLLFLFSYKLVFFSCSRLTSLCSACYGGCKRDIASICCCGAVAAGRPPLSNLDRYLLLAGRPVLLLSIDGTDRRTRTLDRYIDPRAAYHAGEINTRNMRRRRREGHFAEGGISESRFQKFTS